MVVMYFVLRTTIALICLWAGVFKVGAFLPFRASLAALHLLPPRVLTVFAVGIIGVELGISVLLLTDRAVPVASAVATWLFASIAVGSSIALRLGRSAPCHCFGGTEGDVASHTTIARSLALAVGSVWLLALSLSANSTSGLSLDQVFPSLTITLGLVLLLRYSSLLPQAIGYLRAAPPAVVPPTRRISFRHRPLESSLHVAHAPVIGRSSLSMIEAEGLHGGHGDE